MSETGFSLVLWEEPTDGSGGWDFMVSDDGLLLATDDHGAHWRCLGLVDAAEFLVDLGYYEAGLSATQTARSTPPAGRPAPPPA